MVMFWYLFTRHFLPLNSQNFAILIKVRITRCIAIAMTVENLKDSWDIYSEILGSINKFVNDIYSKRVHTEGTNEQVKVIQDIIIVLIFRSIDHTF